MVTAGAEPPLPLLDVDGPLIPIGGGPPTAPEGDPGRANVIDASDGLSNPLLSRLNPMHGERLSMLMCELVWATTWMADANEDAARALVYQSCRSSTGSMTTRGRRSRAC